MNGYREWLHPKQPDDSGIFRLLREGDSCGRRPFLAAGYIRAIPSEDFQGRPGKEICGDGYMGRGEEVFEGRLPGA